MSIVVQTKMTVEVSHQMQRLTIRVLPNGDMHVDVVGTELGWVVPQRTAMELATFVVTQRRSPGGEL